MVGNGPVAVEVAKPPEAHGLLHCKNPFEALLGYIFWKKKEHK